MADPIELSRQFLQAYEYLASPDKAIKQQANLFIYRLSEQPEAMEVAKILISGSLATSEQTKRVHMLQGATLLKQKCQDSFLTLKTPQKIQQKDFIFGNYVSDICIKSDFDRPYVDVIVRVASFLASVCYDSLWPNFFQQMNDVISLHPFSPRRMKIILQIIDGIPDAIRNNTAWNNSQKVNARNLFLEKRDQIIIWCDQALQVYELTQVENKSQYVELLKTAFLCLHSWVESGMDIISHPTLTTKLLKNLVKQQIFMIFGEIIRSSVTVMSPLDSQQPSKFKNLEVQFSNTILVLKYMVQIQQSVFGQGSPKDYVIKTMSSTAICQTYTVIVSRIILRYPRILQTPNELQALLRIMMKSMMHSSKNVSDRGVNFASCLYDDVKRIDAWNNEHFQGVILSFYNEAYLIALHRAMKPILSSREEADEEGDENEEMEEDNDLQIPGSYAQVTFAEYRRTCHIFFPIVYSVFEDICKDKGPQKFFEPLINFLTKNSELSLKQPGQLSQQQRVDLTSAERQREVALFAISSAVISMNDDYYGEYIQQTIRYIMLFINQRTNINVRLAACKLLANFHQNISSSRQLCVNAIKYLLDFVCDPEKCIEMSTSFNDLVEHVKSRDFYELFDTFVEFFKNQLPCIAYNAARERMTRSILNFIGKTENITNQDNCFHSILQNLLGNLAQNLSKDMARMAALLNITEQVTTYLNNIELINRPTLAVDLFSYANHIANILNQVLKDGLLRDGMYSPKKPPRPQDFCLKSSLGIYPNLLKLSFKLAGLPSIQKLPFDENTIISIIEGAIKLFFNKCQENCLLLGFWQVTLKEFNNNKVSSPYFNAWLQKLFPQFCAEFKKLTKFKDVDVLKNVIDLFKDVLNYNRQLLLSVLPQFQMLIMQSLSMNEFILQKAAMIFLDEMVTQKIALQILQDDQVTQLLLNIFQSLNYLPTVTFKPLGNILFSLSKVYGTRLQEKLKICLVNSGCMARFAPARVDLLSKSLAINANLGDDKSMKRILVRISDIITKIHDHPSIWMELELEMRKFQKK